MKVKVVKEFVDKHTGKLHAVGSEFECDDARYNEIKQAGSFVEPAKEQNKEKVKEGK